jgi:hypothetical protein
MVEVLGIVNPGIPLRNAKGAIHQGTKRSIVTQIAQWIDKWPVDPPPNQLSSLRAGILF